MTFAGAMVRLILGAVCALLIWPFFGIYGLVGALPFLVMCGIGALALFGRSDSRSDDDVTRLGL